MKKKKTSVSREVRAAFALPMRTEMLHLCGSSWIVPKKQTGFPSDPALSCPGTCGRNAKAHSHRKLYPE